MIIGMCNFNCSDRGRQTTRICSFDQKCHCPCDVSDLSKEIKTINMRQLTCGSWASFMAQAMKARDVFACWHYSGSGKTIQRTIQCYSAGRMFLFGRQSFRAQN